MLKYKSFECLVVNTIASLSELQSSIPTTQHKQAPELTSNIFSDYFISLYYNYSKALPHI